ncbi:glycosyltransferase family 4 protein [Pseudomonas sp. CDFA 553]|uniref:MraY family glycosyltransferase n=1 Tax=Pseudomonas quasicaspiana TaxID=2829821 RepID=UPI001E396796|nr:glycosyltransferase family 4 protein [Pseudomonas quasicaspiana]MCD5987027.1 glycosyltransferase family 4 protein [Pseudomonas quasicaspiana]
MTQWWLVPLVLLASLLMTAGLRRYALAKSIIDIPNARSSHAIPTPRGGGVAIVLAFLVVLAALGLSDLADSRSVIGLAGAGGLIAIIGFMDDHGHIAARWRLLGHFTSAAWGLYWMGGLPPLLMFGHEFNLGWIGAVLAAFYLVWVLNLYNFMDGIDGIASVEAICACLGACVIYSMAGHAEMIALPLLLAAAVAGFLFWNFPPARIFMGDAGSGFLGIILAMLSLQAAWAEPSLLWCWLILLGVFIVDATVTLIHRLIRGEKVYEAHRSHAYQFATRRFGRHLPVTLAVAVINIVWLLPLAMAVGVWGMEGTTALILAYAPLVFLAFKFSAGAAE